MKKIGIIGVGNVGATVAHVVMKQGLVSQLVLLDKKMDKARSEVIDLLDARSLFSTTTHVSVGDYKDMADADIIISALGHIDLLASDADRFVELKMNAPEVKQVAKDLKNVGFKGILLVITNPCDAMTELYYKQLDLPHQQVIGTGTLLDTSRMKNYVTEALQVDPRSVTGYVLGEHGDSQFVCWSSVSIGGKSIFDFEKERNLDLDDIESRGRMSGYHVHAGKGYTNVAIAEATACILEALINDSHSVLPVSHYHDEFKSYLSTPAIIGKNGVVAKVHISLSEKEKEQLQKSAEEIKEKSEKFSEAKR